ncbi:MAG: DUF6529 family protein [Acidimicrobiales bacterium]
MLAGINIIRFLNQLTGGRLLAWKVVLTTVVFALAGLQVVVAARFWGVTGFPPVSTATAARVHRVNGLIAVTLALVVGFSCLVGPAGPTSPTRVLLHSVFGSLLFAILAVKFALLKLWKSGQRFLPVVGVSLFLTFGAIWATSVADYITAR